MRYKTVARSLSCLLIICSISFSWAVRCEAATTNHDIAQGLAHYIMGVVHDMYGETAAAAEEYTQAVGFDYNNYLLHLRLGANYTHLNRLTEAIHELQLAKKLNSDDPQASYLLALIYSSQKDFDKATVEYETILKTFSEADPNNADIYNYLAQLYYSQQQYDKAIEQFERILEIEPGNAEIMFLIGSLYLEMDERGKAIRFLKKTITTDPEHEGGLNALGYMYAEDGINLDEAESLIGRALALEPENGAYLDSLGWVYFKKGEYKKAIEHLKKAISLFKDPVIYEHLGDVYFTLHQNDMARKYWESSLELLPDQDSILKKIKKLDK